MSMIKEIIAFEMSKWFILVSLLPKDVGGSAENVLMGSHH